MAHSQSRETEVLSQTSLECGRERESRAELSLCDMGFAGSLELGLCPGKGGRLGEELDGGQVQLAWEVYDSHSALGGLPIRKTIQKHLSFIYLNASILGTL